MFPYFFKNTFIAGMCFFAVHANAESRLLDQVVAVVEDDVVLASEVRDRMGQLIQTFRQRGMALPDNAILYEQVMEAEILDRLQLHRAERMGLRVTDQRLSEAMTSIAASNGLSLSDFRQLLIENGDSYVDLRDQIRKDLLLREVQQRNVIRAININKSEVESFLASDRGQALIQPEWNLDHLLLEVANFTDAQEVSEKKSIIQNLRSDALRSGGFQKMTEAIRSAGANYLPLGWLDADSLPTLFSGFVEKLTVGDVSEVIQSESGFHLISLSDIKGGAVGSVPEAKVRHILISESTIRDYEQSKQLVDELHARILAGEDFSLLAREYSDDPGSALSGGDLGWVRQDMMVAEFEKVMNEAELNVLSSAFRSTYGWHILEVTERRQQDIFEERSKQIARQKIAESKYDDALQNWLQELRDNAYVEIK